MKTRAAAIIFAAAATMAACAVPTTGVVPIGNGYYTITNQGGSFLVRTADLKTEALAEAGKHCASQKRELQVINVKEIPAGALGRWPEAEVTYLCK